MKCSWREGNKIQLLENGEQYYPAVFKAIGEAQERIILETFIWFEDDVGTSVVPRSVQAGFPAQTGEYLRQSAL
ncbi:hypothetical protein ACUOFC_66355, partial [Escherichia sp. TWPC-MK]